jgi:ATP-dependent Lon protease
MTFETKFEEKQRFPLIPLRDVVILPQMVSTLFVGRQKSLDALSKALRTKSSVIFACQRSPNLENPNPREIATYGSLGRVSQVVSLPDGTVKVRAEGITRVKISDVVVTAGSYSACAQMRPYTLLGTATAQALVTKFLALFNSYSSLNKRITQEMIDLLAESADEQQLLASISAQLSLTIEERQELLETDSIEMCLERAILYLKREMEAFKHEEKIKNRIREQMTKSHREYYLNEQLKAIQKELGHQNEKGLTEFEELAAAINKTPLSKEAREKVEKELKKLKMMNPASAESSVVRGYIDTVLDLPWGKKTNKKFTLEGAEKILDQDHFGLQKVKERILEFLAVQKRVGKVKGQILCLVGAPGVGKTSLARSIAKATGREYVRMSLGGVRDESEIRGHRRTYIGSMPGKIIQSMRKAKASNPLFLLDEIDKMGSDWRGDPAAAMLEVLDPEQNAQFNDHYLELDYDLSDVFFIATANSLDMPAPLLDRMEIIRLEGYTEDEKLEIAKRHLLKKQQKQNGLKTTEVTISEDALRDLIRLYTREAGVRSLEREVGNLYRKALTSLLKGEQKKITITHKNLEKFAGVPKYDFGKKAASAQIGITTGLAWTSVGGEILMIEAVSSLGKGNLSITGKLGDVMKESIQAAFSFIKSRALSFGIDPETFSSLDFHVHVPEGATPKDGPSAGLAICTSLISVLTHVPVRSSVAMTGEINLRGQALPIGGLKEKLLAAQRSGIETVFIPKGNQKDLADVPETIRQNLKVLCIDTIDDVLKEALTEPLTPLQKEFIHKEPNFLPAKEEDALPAKSFV